MKCKKCGSQIQDGKKFCTKCGAKIDNVSDIYSDNKKITKKELRKNKKAAKKTAKKAAKKEKWKSLSFGAKMKKICLRTFVVLLTAVIIAFGILGMLAYFQLANIPIMSEAIDGLVYNSYSPGVDKDISPTDASGFTYYRSSEENITIDPDTGITFVNNELLVTLVSEEYRNQLEQYLQPINGKIVGEIPELAEYQILFSEARSYSEIHQLAEDLMQYDWTLSASPNYTLKYDTSYIPNDSKWKNKWEDIPDGDNWGMEAIDAQGAWDYKDNFQSVNIGLIDNMFDVNHQDLNFSENPLGMALALSAIKAKKVKWSSHGTHTSGTIAAEFDNNKGVTGVSVNTNLYGISVEGLSTVGYYSTQAWNISFYYLIASKKCSVVNVSMGFPQLTFEASRNGPAATQELDLMSKEIAKTLKLLINENYSFLICKSSGNQNEVGGGYQYFKRDDDETNEGWLYYSYNDYKDYLNGDKTYEEEFSRYKDRKDEIINRLESGNVDAKYDILGAIADPEVSNRIIMVGAAENLGTHKEGGFLIFGRKRVHSGYKIADFSQCGERVDIIAPGVDIHSTEKNGYGKMSGTSMAAPHVAGVAGLVFSVNPNIKPEIAKSIICDSAVGEYGSYKYGLVNAKNAVESTLSISKNDSTESDSSYENGNNTVKPIRATSDERDIVLVLDTSGSMSGEPLDETKKAASKFIDTVLQEEASIGIVTYDSKASEASDFSMDSQTLHAAANDINAGGSTNIEDGLKKAEELLDLSHAKKKIIVLMSDGEPNEGKVGDDLISYADSIKSDSTYIYTLGFFESMGNSKSSAQILMEKIASEGCHYEVANADDLLFFFGDIADQINGQKYIYIRIACPVDVNVTYNGETLRSNESSETTRTSFGTLTFEENENKSPNSTDDRVKILRLKNGVDYSVQIAGNGTGSMNYSIGFMDENGKYSDVRKFNNINISENTKIDTVAEESPSTTLKVDSDGDGNYDLKYKAKTNGIGEIVDYTYILYIIAAAAFLIALLVIYIKLRRWKKNYVEKQRQKLAMKKKFCVHCGNEMPGDKTFCSKCGKRLE